MCQKVPSDPFAASYLKGASSLSHQATGATIDTFHWQTSEGLFHARLFDHRGARRTAGDVDVV